jgi:hypothetical protein
MYGHSREVTAKITFSAIVTVRDGARFKNKLMGVMVYF